MSTARLSLDIWVSHPSDFTQLVWKRHRFGYFETLSSGDVTMFCAIGQLQDLDAEPWRADLDLLLPDYDEE